MILDGEETEFLFFRPTFCCAMHKKLGFDRCEATVCVGVAARAAGMAFYTTGSLSLNTFRVHPLDPDDKEDVAAAAQEAARVGALNQSPQVPDAPSTPASSASSQYSFNSHGSRLCPHCGEAGCYFYCSDDPSNWSPQPNTQLPDPDATQVAAETEDLHTPDNQTARTERSRTQTPSSTTHVPASAQ